jgi:hypothetical protein
MDVRLYGHEDAFPNFASFLHNRTNGIDVHHSKMLADEK